MHQIANWFLRHHQLTNTLIDNIFPSVHTKYKNLGWLAGRVIFATKNVNVNGLNSSNITVVAMGLGVIQIYRRQGNCELPNWLFEFVGSSIIFRHNLNPLRLCNSTRLVNFILKKVLIRFKPFLTQGDTIIESFIYLFYYMSFKKKYLTDIFGKNSTICSEVHIFGT